VTRQQLWHSLLNWICKILYSCVGLIFVLIVRPTEGDSYPLGSLPIGTLVCCVERYPGEGGLVARSAGVSAMLLRRRGDMCIVRLPSKQEIEVSAQCMATVGRVSNIDHNKRVIGKAGRNRWLGIRPRSGRWHRKTGRFGRKIHPPPPVVTYAAKPPRPKPAALRFTLPSAPGIYQSARYWMPETLQHFDSEAQSVAWCEGPELLFCLSILVLLN